MCQLTCQSAFRPRDTAVSKKERETEDARILVEELAALAVGHQQKLEDLEKELKKDERAMQTVFEQERVSSQRLRTGLLLGVTVCCVTLSYLSFFALALLVKFM